MWIESVDDEKAMFTFVRRHINQSQLCVFGHNWSIWTIPWHKWSIWAIPWLEHGPVQYQRATRATQPLIPFTAKDTAIIWIIEDISNLETLGSEDSQHNEPLLRFLVLNSAVRVEDLSQLLNCNCRRQVVIEHLRVILSDSRSIDGGHDDFFLGVQLVPTTNFLFIRKELNQKARELKYSSSRSLKCFLWPLLFCSPSPFWSPPPAV